MNDLSDKLLDTLRHLGCDISTLNLLSSGDKLIVTTNKDIRYNEFDFLYVYLPTNICTKYVVMLGQTTSKYRKVYFNLDTLNDTAILVAALIAFSTTKTKEVIEIH